MADLPKRSRTAAPVNLGERSLAALALLVAAAFVYGCLAFAGIAPLPGSISQLARAQQVGHGKMVTAGYYVMQNFVSMGGPQLPPYTFATSPAKDAPAIHVEPTLADIRAGSVVTLIDLATGDGSEGAPYVIHTVMRTESFATAAAVSALIALALAFWLGGAVAALVRRRG